MSANLQIQTGYFLHTQDQFKEIVSDILKHSKEVGSSDASIEISESEGLSVLVRCGSIDTIEYNRDKIISVTLFFGKKRGSVSTSNFSKKALKDAVEAAYNIALFTDEDEAAGLAERELLETSPCDLDLYHPWKVSTVEAVEIAHHTENSAFEISSKICNSEGASVSTQNSQFILGTSSGFLAGYPSSSHCISCMPIAGVAQNMQCDEWHTSKRSPSDLALPREVGSYAARRALSRIGARRISTHKGPVLFEAPIASGLLCAFAQAISGNMLYRKTSFLVKSIGKLVFSPHIQIVEDPHITRAMGSAPFDHEGVRTQTRNIVKDGIVCGYFLSTYSANKLGVKTTGNAGGSHNLIMFSSDTKPDDDLNIMLKKLDTGLFITELMGYGINYITGDYSRGAFGYWVENGTIKYPVQEITIASTLQDMFRKIIAIGTDSIVRGTKETGSVLIEEMTIGGQ